MSVHTTGGGGASLAAFGGGAAVANRLVWTSDGTGLFTDEDGKFDGTNFAFGPGAIVSGRRVQIHQENSGVGLASRAAAANYDGNLVAESSDSRLLLLRQYGTSAAGTDGGLAIASRGFLQAVNTSGLLIGGSDIKTAVYHGASHASFLGGTSKSLHAVLGNVGAGTDVIQTYTQPAASLARDGQMIVFRVEYIFAANGNTKTPSIQFGGVNIWTPTGTAQNGGGVLVQGWIQRTGAATARACVMGFVVPGTTPITAGLINQAALTPTWANANVLDILGAATADNDITARAWVGITESGN